MELFLMRHPETETAGLGLCLGWTDVALSSAGRNTVGTLADSALRRCNPDVLVSSDLRRCTALAAELYQRGGRSLETSPLWRELHFGAWENRTWEEIERNDRAAWLRWKDAGEEAAAPGGETLGAFRERLDLALDLLDESGWQRILVVTHAGVIRTFQGGNVAQGGTEVPFGAVIAATRDSMHPAT